MANTDYENYHKSGTYVGNENNSGAWTLVGSATNVTAQPMGTPTPLPIPINVVIAGGQVEAFYVTSTNTTISQYYTNGTSVGNVFSSTADLQFTEGCGLEYPFSGSPFTPRVWNGVIHYCQGASGIEEEVNAANNSSVYPNPFSQNAVITLYQPVLNSMVTVNITDVLGHTVQSQSATGQNEFKISRSSLESGIYLYTIMNGNTLIGKGRFVIE
jgi:hypothetical protein